MKRILACVVFLVCSTSGLCHENTTVRLGGGSSIRVPVPPGYRALGNLSPGLRKYIEAGEPPSAVLLEMFLTEDDLAQVLNGHSSARNRELKLEAFRSLYGRDIDRGRFERGVAFLRASYVAVDPSLEARANEAAAAHPQRYGNDPPIASHTTALGTFMNMPDAVGATTCMTVTNHSGADRRCVAQVILFCRKRVILMAVATTVRDKSDVGWAINTAKAWALDTLTANAGQ